MKKNNSVVALLLCVIALLIIYSTITTIELQQNSNSKKEKTLNTTVSDVESTSETTEKIPQQEHGKDALDAAEYFLSTYYQNENNTEEEILLKIKSLVCDQVYQSLLPPNEEAADSNEYNMEGVFYKTYISDIVGFYNPVSETEVDVFIYCTLNVQSNDTVNTSSSLIFSARMVQDKESWLVSQILKNSVIREN